MADCCNTCGKTDEDEELSYCQKCKSVAYCSRKCQKRDFENHRQTCKRWDAAGTAPCDFCYDTEKNNDIINVCVECGTIACKDCAIERRAPPCRECHSSFLDRDDPEYVEKLEELIQENRDDPRRSQWVELLARAYSYHNNESKAMMYYKVAGSLGFAKGYNGASQLYIGRQDWGNAKEYLEKAADLDDVVAMEWLSSAAMHGYFFIPRAGIEQEDHGHEPDWEEAYYWAQIGARLGHPNCCGQLGTCYLKGEGVAQDYLRAFRWSRKGAEKGSQGSMAQCAVCYEKGYGVEQSNEEAIEWLEKSLELQDEEDTNVVPQAMTRRWLERLQARVADQAHQT